MKGWTGILLAAGLAAGTTFAFLTGGSVILALAYGALVFVNWFLRTLQSPFVPLILTAKLIMMTDAYVEKRKKINKYLNSGAKEANETRMAEAGKIIKSLERLDSDPSQHMPEDLREQMLAYFSDEKRDLGTLMDTAKKMQDLAKKQKSLRAAYISGDESINPSGMKAVMLSDMEHQNSSEPKHNNFENYRTVHL